jgi:hypothetical protein
MKGDAIVELIVFVILVVGGIINDMTKKNKEKKRAEAPKQPPIQPKVEGTTRQFENDAPKPRQTTPPSKRAAAPNKKARNEESEWLQTLADRKRRETAKTAAKLAVAAEPEYGETAINEEQESTPSSSSAAPISLSLQKAMEGIVLAEILGPPVSLRR